MFNNIINKKSKETKIEKPIETKIENLKKINKLEDSYILNDENAIIVIKNNTIYNESDYYIMIHKRLKDGKLIEVNRWYMKTYYYGLSYNDVVIKDLNLFQIQSPSGELYALYDYKNDKFIVQMGDWKSLTSGPNNSILEKYNGFLATFDITSDDEEDDVYSYINPITNETIVESFSVHDKGHYYAIINTDGTIRGNKLFKGFSSSKIFEIIDLNKYDSLQTFKNERIQKCNNKKRQQKQEYLTKIETRNNSSISPYLDQEVVKILSLKK